MPKERILPPLIAFLLLCCLTKPGWAIDPVLMAAKRAEVLDFITDLSNGNAKGFRGAISGQNCYHGSQILDSSWEQGYRKMIVDLHAATGKWVGIIGVDYEWARIFTRDQLSRTNEVLIAYARQGGLVTINLAPQNPWVNDETDLERNPGSYDGPSGSYNAAGIALANKAGLGALLDPGRPEHAAWMRKLDRIAAALKELRDAGVVVLYRPLQEMNGSWYWWGMTSHPSDPGPYVRLYRHMHDYFSIDKGLDNLIWVYSPNASLGQTDSSSWNRSVDWAYPGADYVDIVAGTSYSDDLNLDDYARYVKLGKPLGIAEYGPRTDGPLARSGSLDTRKIISRIKSSYPRVAYWVSWHSYAQTVPRQCWSLISNLHYAELMNDPLVITRDDFRWEK